MIYTKAQLIAAFIEARGIEETDIPVIEVEIEAKLDAQRIKIQARLDNLPTAKQRMKSIALQHLAKSEKLQSIADNENVTL